MPPALTPFLFMPAPVLAQLDDEPSPPPPPPPARPMTFSDLQQGLRDVHSGKVDTSGFRNGVLGLLAVLALVVLFIHFRQRRKTPQQPDSLGRLGRELGRKVSFPLGAKFMLKRVARATQTPYPALLLSSALFDKCVTQWSGEPTFAAVRSWGRNRLQRLRPVLFEE